MTLTEDGMTCKDAVNATTIAAGLATLAVWATRPLTSAGGKTQQEIHLGGVAAWLGAMESILLEGISRRGISRSAETVVERLRLRGE